MWDRCPNLGRPDLKCPNSGRPDLRCPNLGRPDLRCPNLGCPDFSLPVSIFSTSNLRLCLSVVLHETPLIFTKLRNPQGKLM